MQMPEFEKFNKYPSRILHQESHRRYDEIVGLQVAVNHVLSQAFEQALHDCLTPAQGMSKSDLKPRQVADATYQAMKGLVSNNFDKALEAWIKDLLSQPDLILDTTISVEGLSAADIFATHLERAIVKTVALLRVPLSQEKITATDLQQWIVLRLSLLKANYFFRESVLAKIEFKSDR
ncbi:MAG TPA: hypothetical protein VD999_05415 [Vitreimonas sp.]|nr:hypothetical protein [Vitreimonas sp.]